MIQGVRGILAIASIAAAVIIVACGGNSPSAPSTLVTSAASHAHGESADNPSDQNSAAHVEKGYIDGWFNGEAVQLHYTKWYFCAEPPSSGAPSNCELGADAETAPRPGPIPTIYAIAAAGGIQPDLSTLACPPGSVCLNHPAMLDASRVLGAGATNIPAVPHSHIVTERRGGWFHTVNIRVRSLTAWNQIADAKSLDKVRELQADPNFGGAGLVSADTPTNIYFFIASWK